MTATLKYQHPTRAGPAQVDIDDYAVKESGVLVALTLDGEQITLSASTDWLVIDDGL